MDNQKYANFDTSFKFTKENPLHDRQYNNMNDPPSICIDDMDNMDDIDLNIESDPYGLPDGYHTGDEHADDEEEEEVYHQIPPDDYVHLSEEVLHEIDLNSNDETDNKLCITFHNGSTEIDGPYETRVLYKHSRKLHYFDTQLILEFLSNRKHNMKVESSLTQKIRIEGTYNDIRYELVVIPKDCYVILTNLNIPDANDIDAIPNDTYLVYQETSNPTLCIYTLILMACYSCDTDSKLFDIMRDIKIPSSHLEFKNYYCDDLTVLVVSSYYEYQWFDISDVCSRIIPTFINEISTSMSQLHNSTDIMKPDTLAKLADMEHYYKLIMDLDNKLIPFKKEKTPGELLEAKIGELSYFIIKENNTLFSFAYDNFGSYQKNILPEKYLKYFQFISKKLHEIRTKMLVIHSPIRHSIL